MAIKRGLVILRKMTPRLLKYRSIRKRILQNKEVPKEEIEEEARKFVDTMIELGPTFIKLGQVLSVHPDVLPQEYMRELQRLQDEVPPAPYDQVKEMIFKEAGDIIQDVDPEPVAAASLGQVHVGVLKDGTKVAIKVNRPRVEEVLKEDISLIRTFLPFTRLLLDAGLVEALSLIFRQFSTRIFEELNYEKEAFYTSKIKDELEGFRVKIPRTIKASRHVLVMEYLPGFKITSKEALESFDRKNLAWRVFKVFVYPVLKGEYFHADPHPGNISIDQDGNIILYDFGMSGYIDRETRIKLIRMYVTISRGDPIMLVNVLDQLGAIQPYADRKLLAKGFELMIKGIKGIPVDQLELEEFNRLASEAFFKFPLRLPERIALYFRMSSVLEGTCRMIDPDFDFLPNLVRLVEEEGLLRLAFVDEVMDYVNFLSTGMKERMLKSPQGEVRNSRKWVGIPIVAMSIPTYLLVGDVTAILVALLGLTVTLSLP
ncbi:AarF/ABC1/UbiB kinase family protein [Metallosphaera tengchongensis]|uniref:AarF/ABC1/UbiB kinase family protein n=1 Tax=Metallosphaera tengchongensis TaxID=1532350 RepID=A0A6N0NV98_9CREN|nr:AarF/UbiB family protein [Metallosphaera tengchongensis]QKQ99060.1 AarF/ABC1/UbiB kinase family protein [Metallosphaera tengchongensis]